MAIYQIVLNHTWLGQSMKNVLHYETTSQLTPAQFQEAADDLRTHVAVSSLTNRLDDAWSLDDITIRQVDIADLPSTLVTFTSGPVDGTQGIDAPMASQVAMLLTGLAFAQYPRTVRTYWPGWTYANLNQFGEFDAGAITEGGNLIEGLDQLFVTGDTLNRVAVQYTGSPPIVTASNTLDDYKVNKVPSTLRSRRKGVGE